MALHSIHTKQFFKVIFTNFYATLRIIIAQRDITKADVGANSWMLESGGGAGVIHWATGLELLATCKKVLIESRVRSPAGQTRITMVGI
jgi:O-acetyl-ADP-ribose deacetylase (regulator of RNase III)